MLIAPHFRTLLVTDLVGSTALVERLGDGHSAGLFARTDRVARDLLAAHNGREIDRTDGFLLLFERPIDAVRFALALHAALAALGTEIGEALTTRTGIHFAEVVLRENPPEDVARGAKPLEVEGLAKPLAARVMSLAQGGQTLLTRAAFDLARRASIGTDAVPSGTEWRAHGRYVLKGIDEPIEVSEVGTAGVAPLRAPMDSEKAKRALAPGEEELLGWRPAPGQTIPGRDNWALVDKLGEGGFGEVWLARQTKTKEPRVFKFCFEAERLRGLKREVTLFRLLKETLGDRDDISRVLDWSFDSAPFFIEGEYTAGGSLVDWAEGQGGLAAVPLATRLELVAQVAEALAAAHSVGVLHKDIKPANVLVYTGKDGAPRARLTDFGIGAITEKERLAVAGVTNAGFTEETLTDNDSSHTGTRLYMAPELLEGKTATIKADIYALGVVLYQAVTGDLRRAITGDWRDDIDDELLREDIAVCVAGDMRKRVANAERIAERLRKLEERRTQIDADRRAEFEAEAAVAALERSRKRRRVTTVAGVGGAFILLVVFALLVRAKQERARAEIARDEAKAQSARADAARAEAEDLVGFMLGDLTSKLQPIGRLDIMDGVLAKVDVLLQNREGVGLTPSEREALTIMLGQVVDLRVLQGRLEEADNAARRGLKEAEALAASSQTNAVWQRNLGMAWGRMGSVFEAQGKLEEARQAYMNSFSIMEKLAAANPANTQMQLDLAMAWNQRGAILKAHGKLVEAQEAFDKHLSIVEKMAALEPANAWLQRDLGVAWNWKGGILQEQGKLDEALEAFENCRAILEKLTASDPGNAVWQNDLAAAWYQIGEIFWQEGRLEEAKMAFESNLAITESLVAADPTNTDSQSSLSVGWNWIGGIQEEQGMLKEAWEAYKKDLAIREKLVAADPTNAGWQRELGVTWNKIGSIHRAQGRLEEAQEAFGKGLATSEKLAALDPANTGWQGDLAFSWHLIGDALQEQGKLEGAQEAYEKDLAINEKLTASDPTNAGWSSNVGASWAQVGGILEARGKPEEAREAYQCAVQALDVGRGISVYAVLAYARVGRAEVARNMLQVIVAHEASKRLPPAEKQLLGKLCAELGIQVPGPEDRLPIPATMKATPEASLAR